MATFKTIRQTAATGLLSEHRLRLMHKAGLLPGIAAGNRFLVNVDALVQQLDEASCATVKRDGATVREQTKSPPTAATVDRRKEDGNG